MAIISGDDILSALDNSKENIASLEAAADKYLGVTDEGAFPEDVIRAFQRVGAAAPVAGADAVETFAAGFVSALKLVEDKIGSIE